MHQLWMAFTDNPTRQHMAERDDLRGRTCEQAFEEARRVGALNGRAVKWMLLVDPDSEQRDVIACYGDRRPPGILGVHSFRFAPATKRYPTINPTKQ